MGLTAAVLAATFMPPAHAQTANPKPVKVISSLPTLTSAATYLMSARGFDKKFGMAVDITQSGASSTIQVDAVLSGSAAFGHPGTATALQAIREGADIQIVGAITNNQIAAVISNDALKKSGLALNAPIADRIKALKGMTIGTNPEGSTYALMLRLYLQEQGINPDKDVRLVGIAESSALITGMEQGRYDAIVSASGVVEQAISQKLGQLWFSGARGDIPGSEKSVVAVIITHTNTVKNNPELVTAYRNAMNESLKALRQDHAGAGKTLQEKHFSKMDPALWNEVWTNTTNAYPTELKFTRSAYDFWITNDPKGAASFSKVDYSKVVIPEAQEK
ncbi:MAG: ABC transporter substrate-binding protein [Methylocystaceae bacterium]|nr:ABC transporter substrate-binding protein [Methylocystaceae bacterium]